MKSQFLSYCDSRLVVLFVFLEGLTAQPLITGESWADIGEDTTLTCSPGDGETISLMRWRNSSFDNSDVTETDLIVQFLIATGNPFLRDETHYEFDSNEPYSLTIKQLTLDDEARYWCEMLSIGYIDDFIDTQIRVPPATISLTYMSTIYTDQASVEVVAGDGHQFSCETFGIKPNANFTWTLQSTTLFQGLPGTTSPNSDDSRLSDSSSTVSLSVPESPATQQLTCGATNRQDGSTDTETDTTVNLQVKVPPKSSKMSLPGTNAGGTLSVDEGLLNTITCLVMDTRPAATIKWFLNGVMQSTGTVAPPSADSDELYDTTGSWQMTPTRDNHKDEVMCQASTAQSQGELPNVTAVLDVNGPPDTPFITGSLQMTVNVQTSLVCAADMGYPDDWSLQWFNEETAITPNPTTTPSSSGNRFMFTSTLDFTPVREYNGRTIKCGAQRNSKSSPKGTLGPIKVQYEVEITNKEENEMGVNDGKDAVISCKAVGNPVPVMMWYDPNNIVITSTRNPDKYTVEDTTTGGNDTYGFMVTSNLTIKRVDSQVDYGVYTCTSHNGIGREDMLMVLLNGTRRPNKPTGVVLTDRTSSSIAIRWTAGYDGGEPQWFHVSHKKTADSSETVSGRIDGGVTTYNVTGLEPYTEYEIKIYAENDLGRNPSPGSVVEYTLPGAPISDSDFTLLFDSIAGTVIIDGLVAKGGCIRLEVKYEGIEGWNSCGDCIATDGNIKLSYWCSRSRTRRRRAIGDVEAVRARLCQMNGQLCSDFIDVGESASSTGIVVGVVVGVVSLAVIVILLGLFFRKKFKNRNGPEEVNLTKQRQQRRWDPKRYEMEGTSDYQEITEMAVVESANKTYANVISKDDSFPRDMLNIVKELGQGAFGQVFLAEANGIIKKSTITLVAVKTLKDGARQNDKDDLMRELDLMKKLPGHKNVVRLMGFSVEQDPPYIIVEYLSKGNLKDLMKDSRSKGGIVYGNLHGASKSLTSGDLMKFANDVADGMHYISSQKCIHRDLAARNVLVAEDMTCKVSDFGLARDVIDNRVYERKSEGRLPLRWMALESILDEMYTTKSDVWSFGVLLWEIVTLGARPYPTMSAKMMLNELRGGYRMPKPTHCQDELYHMMLKCWEEQPEKRPTFKVITDELQKLREEDKDYIIVTAYEETIYVVTIPDGEQEKC